MPVSSRRRVVLVVVVVLLAVAGIVHLRGRGTDLSVELPDAAGIRGGDDVRIAGIDVGSVRGIAARGDKVIVEIHLDRGVEVPAATRTEVKLGSLLGQRYLDLRPGKGRPLNDGDTIALAHASGAYTIERFWIDSAPALTQLDLGALSKAVDVLSTDLAVSPDSSRDALTGLSAVAQIAVRRDAQLGKLLAATRTVTDEVVAQREQITSLMGNADEVFTMIAQRRQALDVLLRESRQLVTDLGAMAKTNAAPMAEALTQLRTILGVLRQHRKDLADTLKLASPAMRLYVNSSGDGPWLGVNAPYFIMPDSFWCLTRKDIGCR